MRILFFAVGLLLTSIYSAGSKPWLRYMPSKYRNSADRAYYEEFYKDWYMRNKHRLKDEKHPARRPSSTRSRKLKNRSKKMLASAPVRHPSSLDVVGVQYLVELSGSFEFTETETKASSSGVSGSTKTELSSFGIGGRFGWLLGSEQEMIAGPYLNFTHQSIGDNNTSMTLGLGAFFEYYFMRDQIWLGAGLDGGLAMFTSEVGTTESDSTGFEVYPFVVARYPLWNRHADVNFRVGYLYQSGSGKSGTVDVDLTKSGILSKFGLSVYF